MGLNYKNSKLFSINLFSDYILSQVPKKENFIIQIADCQNFLVLKGKTSIEEPLDILKLKTDFCEEYKNVLIDKFGTHTIDLIDYGQKIESNDFETFEFYNSENFTNTSDEVNKLKLGTEIKNRDLVFVSQFPFGYSLTMGRTIYYYALLLMNSIPTSFHYEKIKMSIPKKFNEEQFHLVVDGEIDEKLKSFFLDHFDFNFKSFEKKILDYNFLNDLMKPFELPTFVTDIPKDMVFF